MLKSKAVQFVLIWIVIIIIGLIITQTGYNFLKAYTGSYPILSGFIELINVLPVIFFLLGLVAALKAVGLIED